MWQYNRPGLVLGFILTVLMRPWELIIIKQMNVIILMNLLLKIAEFYKGEAPCSYCPNNCIKRYATDGDNERMGGLHQEALGSLGPNLGNSDLLK